MVAVGGTFKALSAVAFFFAWKYYKLPNTGPAEGVSRQDSSPSDVASQITIVDGNSVPKEKMEAELVPVAQFITVADSSEERVEKEKESMPRITNV